MRFWAFLRKRRCVRLRSSALVAAVVLVLLAGGCAEESSQSPSEGATADSSPAIDPVEAEAVIDAYRTWRRIQDEVLTGQRDIEDVQTELDAVVTGQAVDDLQESMDLYTQHGVVVQGRSSISPEVTAMNLDGVPPTAILTDCLDTSNTDIVDAETGESRKVSSEVQSERVVVTAQAEKTSDGRWAISEVTTDFDRSC
ncbi:hypothetical protein ABH917_000879 [Thermobifida halotolerans]